MTAKHVNCLIVFVLTLLGCVSLCVESQVTQRGGGSAPLTFSAWLTWFNGKDNETLSQFNHRPTPESRIYLVLSPVRPVVAR